MPRMSLNFQSSLPTTDLSPRRMSRALIALGTAATITIASTGIATAEDGSENTGSSGSSESSSSSGSSSSSTGSTSHDSSDLPESPTGSLAELSHDRDVFGSITGADVLGSYTNGQIDYEKVLDAIASLATGMESIASIAESISAIVNTTTSSMS